ncbi:MAG: BNR-4 repeat-containing protein [Armatimonadota bacterium]
MTTITRILRLSLLIVALSWTAAQGASLPPAVRGGKTILLQVEPGPLEVTVLKRDLNIYESEDTLHADLFDPLGRRLAQVDIPDDGIATAGGGHAQELQSATMSVDARVAGLHRLAIRCGGDLVYGMESSVQRYVVAGEMLFSEGSVGGRLFFEPPAEAFTITASALHDPGRQTVPLLNAGGDVLGELNLDVTGEEHTLSFEAGPRGGLWSLDIAALDVRLAVSGVQHWSLGEGAWFDATKSKWMLLPYRTARYLQPGERTVVELRLRNSTGASDRFDVEVSADPGAATQILEPHLPVQLDAGQVATVRVQVTALEGARAGDEYDVGVTARALNEPAAQASSGLAIRIGESPVSRLLDLPIVLRPYEHEDVQFGYAPDYMTNEVYFDLANRPAIRQRTESHYNSTGVFLLEDGHWVERGFMDAVRAAHPNYRSSYGAGGFLGAKVAFDGQGGMYTMMQASLADSERIVLLLFSPDEGRSWQVYDLPGGSFDIEQFTGHNALDIPPPVLCYVTTAPHPATFASYNDLLLFMPRREGERLVIGEPVLVSSNCLGSCQHSGGPASTATRAGRTHIVWGEISGNPDGSGADERGVPTYVATYDHATGQLGATVLLGYGPPVNDVHNVPAITMDSEGYLHVLIGAHGANFQYTRSLAPNDAYAGWTEPEPILRTDAVSEGTDEDGEGRQTYISLVCDHNDTLHTAFRQWRAGVDPYFDGALYAALSVQHKPKDGPWSDAQPIVVPAVPGYSIYYHKLTVDRVGALYLSYSYWTSDTTYQDQFPERYHHRAVVVSRDGGQHWKLAETADFMRGTQLWSQR